jgi:hypothetical protein
MRGVVHVDELLRPGERFGERDDTELLTSVLQRFAASPYDALDLGTRTYQCDRTVEVEDMWGKSIYGDSATITSVTDTGGLSGTDVTSRAHLRFRNCGWLFIAGLTVHGTKQRSGRNRTFEAQHGFHLLGCEVVHLERCRVADVHGDAFNVASHYRERHPSKNVFLRGCVVSRVGRAGVCANDFESLRVIECEWWGIASTVMLVEAGRRPTTLGPLTFARNRIVGGGGAAVHLVAGGRMRLEDVTIADNRRTGRFGFAVWVDGPDKDTAGARWPLFRNIEVVGNSWTQPEAPGRMFRFRDAAHVRMTGNRGPVNDAQYLAHNGAVDDGKRRPFVTNCVDFRSWANVLQVAR